MSVVVFLTVLVLALGLAMDATAVAAARCVTAPRVRTRDVVVVPLVFGAFQAFMPLLGGLLGASAGSYVEAFDHWIAFVLLTAIGAHMLWEARETKEVADDFSITKVLALGVATSIDAFAAGITLPLMDLPLVVSIATIGVTTFVLSALGALAGRTFGSALGKRLEIVGGVALIALGAKIVLEHLGVL
jgi:putative Mn2+ efflux pump MntP